jgi:hypothetical protein
VMRCNNWLKCNASNPNWGQPELEADARHYRRRA